MCKVKHVGVVGGGKMGKAIFCHLLKYDIQTSLVTLSGEKVPKLKSEVANCLRLMAKRGIISAHELEKRNNTMIVTTDLAILENCDIVIESIVESRESKSSLLTKIDTIVSENCLITSNSSSLKPSELSENMNHPVVGLHFFYPLQTMKIVEVISSDNMPDTRIGEFLQLIEKEPFYQSEAQPFILNRVFYELFILGCYYLEKYRLKPREIDRIITTQLPCPGIFEFADRIGVDLLKICCSQYAKMSLSPDLAENADTYLGGLGARGYLGRQSGIGFYVYRENLSNDFFSDYEEFASQEIESAITIGMKYGWVNIAKYFALTGKTSFPVLEDAIKQFFTINEGPFAIMEKEGSDTVERMLSVLYKKTGVGIFAPIKDI